MARMSNGERTGDHRWAHRLAGVFALTSLGVALLAGAGAGVASADYTVWSCRGPDGAAVSAAAWQSAGTAIDEFRDDCAAGGALTVTVPAGRSGTYVDDGGYRFQTTGGSKITGYRLWRTAMTAGGTSPSGGGFYAGVLVDDFGFSGTPVDACYATASCAAQGEVTDPLGTSWDQPANVVENAAPVSLSSVSLAAGCSAPVGTGSCPDTGGTNAQIRLYRARFTISDASAPTLGGKVVGLPADGVSASGTPVLVVPVSDEGAGVQAATLLVDGRALGTTTVADCVEPFSRPGPCPASTALGFTLDTTTLVNGSHQLTVDARDGAGNVATILSRAITVDNAVVGPPVDPPVDPPATPPVAVAGDYAVTVDTTRLTSGKPGTLSGRVVTRTGAPVPGATLVLEWRTFGTYQDEWTALRTVTADGAGDFSVPTSADPRQLRLRLVPAGPANATFVSAPVSVYGRLGLSVRRSAARVRNGRSVTLTGRMTGAGSSAKGTEVLVEAIVGGRWQAVDRLRASSTGTVRWRYRFQRTTHRARYSFRLRVVKSAARWPWPTTASKTVRVLVVP